MSGPEEAQTPTVERRSPNAARRRRADWATTLASIYLVAVAAVVLTTRRWGDDRWLSTAMLFAPRWVYALPSVVLLPLSALRWRRQGRVSLGLLVVASGLLIWFNDVHVSPSVFAREPTERPLRVMTYNVGGGTFAPASLVDLITSSDIDVAGLEECPGVDEAAFAAEGYTARNDGGICLITRLPIRAVDIRDRADMWAVNGSGGINRYELEWAGRVFSIQVVHLETVREGLEALRYGFWKPGWEGPQRLRENIAERAMESREALSWTRRAKVPMMIIGDFNFPVDSAIYRTYWSSFHNALSEEGSGLLNTKATRWHGIRIDHILFDEGWTCRNAWVARDLGMDHRPVVAEFSRSGARASP